MTLTALARALKLVIVIQDLSSTNKTFLESWGPRRTHILKTVRDMAVVKLGMLFYCSLECELIVVDAAGTSVPRSICRELILTVLQDLPSSLMEVETLPKVSMSSLVSENKVHTSTDESPTTRFIGRCPKNGVSSPKRSRKETYGAPRHRSWSRRRVDNED